MVDTAALLQYLCTATILMYTCSSLCMCSRSLDITRHTIADINVCVLDYVHTEQKFLYGRVGYLSLNLGVVRGGYGNGITDLAADVAAESTGSDDTFCEE